MTYSKRLHYDTRRPGAACLWVIMCLMTIGSASLLNGLADQKSLAATSNSGDIPTIATPLEPISERGIKPSDGKAAGLADQPATTDTSAMLNILPFAEPISIELPSVQIKSELVTVGKAADGSMEVPKAPNFDKAAWYRHSPSPGQYGSSIIVGHVDSHASNGGSVFFNLAQLKLNERIIVKRADQTNATFTVLAVRDYGKAGLPADVIYKPVTDSAELRLITCSGRFDKVTQSYENVTVIFATLLTAAANTAI